MFIQHTNDSLQVNIKTVEKRPLRRQILDNKARAHLVNMTGQVAPLLPRLGRVRAEQADLGHEEGLALLGEPVHLGHLLVVALGGLFVLLRLAAAVTLLALGVVVPAPSKILE